MVVRVLVVDDSRFFRRRVQEMLESDARIKVIGSAENGLEAIQKSSRLKPDVITMDIEMPIMDGIRATKRILATQDIPILIFSSLTTEGAKTTFDALDAGAVDYLPKRFEDISKNKIIARLALCERVLAVVSQAKNKKASPLNRSIPSTGKVNAPLAKPTADKAVNIPGIKTGGIDTTVSPRNSVVRRKGQYKLVVIGTSTGGPVALQTVLTGLPEDFHLPILLIQHMPGSFTNAFAKRLDGLCNIKVAEANEGQVLQPGTAYLAPGGKQMALSKRGAGLVIKIADSEPNQNYKPSVDTTLLSVANYEPNNTLVIIMTGMGADGCKGAQELKKKGSTIWAQDEASSVVYGMPAAVVEAGIVDYVLSLDDIRENLIERV